MPRLCKVGLRCVFAVVLAVNVTASVVEQQALLSFAQQLANFEVSQCARVPACGSLQRRHVLAAPCLAHQEATNLWQKHSDHCRLSQLVLTGVVGARTIKSCALLPRSASFRCCHVSTQIQSWTGVTCTPNGNVLCLDLVGWGLEGNVSALELLRPLQKMQMVNLANNRLSGEYMDCPHLCATISCMMHIRLGALL